MQAGRSCMGCVSMTPAKQLRLCWLQVKVADRTVIVTTDAETRVSEPKGLQALIDAAVAGVPSGREAGHVRSRMPPGLQVPAARCPDPFDEHAASHSRPEPAAAVMF